MAKKAINGGHLAAKYMQEIEKVRVVFTISGGHIESLLDGFARYAIRTIDVRHEQAAAMMAHAWSVYNNEPGVCLVTAGPGFTNALTGIANAHLENVPLVLLGGRHPLKDDLKGALQEINQIDMVKPITKWCATCYDVARIPEYLSIAFRQATMGRQIDPSGQTGDRAQRRRRLWLQQHGVRHLRTPQYPHHLRN